MIIRTEDFTQIEKLSKGSHKKVWFICDFCGIGILQEYRNYLKQKNGKFCRSCRNKNTAKRKDVKLKQSLSTKNLWKDKSFRNKTSAKISIGCKKSWTDERRKNFAKNNPMKNIEVVKKVVESESISISELKDICKKYNYKFIKRILGKRGGSRILFECDNGHIQEKRLDSFRKGSYRCNECVKSRSDGEIELSCFIKELGFDIIENDRNLIKPLEVDILIPSKKLCIEYCGLYWHSEAFKNDKNYHLNKLNKCNEKGYNLITIFEDEWMNNKNIVKSRLRHILGVDDNFRIYARNCEVSEINYTRAKKFCEKYHIQGYAPSVVKLGAFYNFQLVAVMTFARPSLSKGRKDTNSKNVFELSRFCTSKNVVGIAGKMLKHFQRNYNWIEIYSFADKRWSNGNLYKKIGFEKVNDTKPNYFYFNNSDLKRYHRFNFRKNVLKEKLEKFDSNKTEIENMINNGWNRIFDCGNIKFIIK